MAITTSENDIKERLSVAYVTAVAARAGCQISNPHIDKTSIDAIVCPIFGSKSPIHLQLKATSEKLVVADQVRVALSVKNYDDLRDTSAITNLNEEPKAFDGVTTIDALVEGKMRRVFVTFAKDDTKIRDTLIDAFKFRRRISFSGELAREGRRLRLENPRDLAVLPATDEE